MSAAATGKRSASSGRRRRQVDADALDRWRHRNAPETIRHDGERIGALPSVTVLQRRIAMVPEGRRLFPSLTARRTCRSATRCAG
jgi:hypothetical protein